MERWPPVYDAVELAGQIKTLAARDALLEDFFSDRPASVAWCQGDVVRLPAVIPILNERGAALADNAHLTGWLLLSNTCDLDRSLTEVEWAQAVPIFQLGTDENVSDRELLALRRYQYSRQFYLPAWVRGPRRRHYVADLTMPVTVSRRALASAQRLARLSMTGWLLLHSCLVRFLARGDGRFD
ncbi:MAG: hypothetical protein ABW106_09560 [Steroidobacteraceae bacterium]